MNTIRQTVHIPADRRLRLDLTLPDDFPVGEAEMTIIFLPTADNISDGVENGESAFTASKRLGCMQGLGILGRDTDIKTCFFRQFEQGCGDYTAERERLLADVTMEDFEAYVERSRKKAAE
jgi:hypothetical protein